MAKTTQVKQELEKMPYEPLLPIDKSLILWSLVLGGILMIVLIWASYTFFPGG